MRTLAIAVMLTGFTGCMSTMTVYRNGTVVDKNGNASGKALKAFAFAGDITGPFDLNVTHGSVSLSVHDPSPNTPTAQRLVTNKAGEIIGVERTPIVAGYSNSRSTLALFAGISKTIRATSNLAGTILSGWLGIESVRSAASASIAQTNADKATNLATTRAGVATNASNNATKVALAETAARGAAPAAGSTINATVPAVVTPVVP